MNDQDHAELFVKRLITSATVAAKKQGNEQRATQERQQKVEHYQSMMRQRMLDKRRGRRLGRTEFDTPMGGARAANAANHAARRAALRITGDEDNWQDWLP